MESSRPCVPKHAVRGFNGSGWRLLCSRDWCLLSETFQTTFSHIQRLPRAKTPPFWERQESWLLPIAFKTHTIGMDQSTLDISRVLWHHLPMAYKYTPPSGVALCCRDGQDAVIHSWVTRRRREKLHCTNPAFLRVQRQIDLLPRRWLVLCFEERKHSIYMWRTWEPCPASSGVFRFVLCLWAGRCVCVPVWLYVAFQRLLPLSHADCLLPSAVAAFDLAQKTRVTFRRSWATFQKKEKKKRNWKKEEKGNIKGLVSTGGCV